VNFEPTPGQLHTEHLLATTAEVAGTATLRLGGITLRVWRHPADPRLPGLAPACDPALVLGWLRDADVQSAATPAALHVDLLSYRPLRRAVLRATLDDQDFYLKVMRPGYDQRVALRQELLAAADLTVPVLSRPAPGVLLSPAIQGLSLARVLAGWQRGQEALPSPGDLIGLLDRLPAAILDLPRRESWSENLEFHAATASQQLPHAADRIGSLAREVTHVLDQGRHGPIVPTHGDVYEANIFADRDTLRFIDIDSVGPGLREDDLACCLAHLALLPGLDPDAYARVPEVVDAWQAAFEQQADATDLRARTAGVLLSLIAGAGPEQATKRLAIAEHFVATAG
jgi:Ser/Thr protein kinase RdoA (MazF antagonist)